MAELGLVEWRELPMPVGCVCKRKYPPTLALPTSPVFAHIRTVPGPWGGEE